MNSRILVVCVVMIAITNVHSHSYVPEFGIENHNLILMKNDTCMPLIDLEPKIVFNYFCGISKTPRPSGKLQLITKYIEDYASKYKFESKKDAVGNILVKVPASRGYENSKITCLQAHIDMVAEKDQAHENFDFDTQPIQLILEDGWLRANGTTLGGDNGIGMSLALSVASDSTVKHGPLELLFTSDEEIGLIGAVGLEKGFINSHFVLNLDGSFNPIIIGCAGGATTTGVLKYTTETSSDNAFGIQVDGLRGGHSGVDITRQRANAIKIIIRVLFELQQQNIDFKLISLKGGAAHNAIPRYSYAEIQTQSRQQVQSIVDSIMDGLQQEYAISDPDIKITLRDVKDGEKVRNYIAKADATRIINSLFALPHGCVALNLELPGNEARTSTNLAFVETKDGKITVITSQRSDFDSARDAVVSSVVSVFKLAGYNEVMTDGVYPGWVSDPNSELAKTAQKVFKKVFDEYLGLKTIHGGLEAGIISKKIDEQYNADAISFGLHVEDAHSPTERFKVSELEPAYKFVKALVSSLKDV